jgi:hypothetical protein
MPPIAQEDVEKDLDQIEQKGMTRNQRSTIYCLVASGHHYAAPQSYQINERFGEYYAERRFTMQPNSSFAAAVYVAARETPI